MATNDSTLNDSQQKRFTLTATSIDRRNGHSVLTGPVRIDLTDAICLSVQAVQGGVCVALPGAPEDHFMPLDETTLTAGTDDGCTWVLSDRQGSRLTIVNRCVRPVSILNQRAAQLDVRGSRTLPCAAPGHALTVWNDLDLPLTLVPDAATAGEGRQETIDGGPFPVVVVSRPGSLTVQRGGATSLSLPLLDTGIAGEPPGSQAATMAGGDLNRV